ncbi:hypothetical protein CVT24_011852 [Panaeolus cyanescens]|uniref:Cytochrome c oxidase assembly factor 3 n=1 Tax=Panaeolus cyanescens TaxID=181874 RepID=A0A409YP81_9AGAR|nr:hypothetical protein CVT24_011852 [Panaeolus cyanescens]
MSQYVDRNEAQKSYRPTAGSMSPGLKRAREPYRLKNALLGLTLGAFAVGIWAYSISAVKQDVFDDVDDDVLGKGADNKNDAKSSAPIPVPAAVAPIVPEPPVVQAPVATTIASTSIPETPVSPQPPSSPVLSALSSSRPRGVIAALASRSGRVRSFLDPQSQTIVWGAPSVDQLGKIGDSKAT